MTYDNIIAITVVLAILIAGFLALRPSAKKQADFLHFWRTGEIVETPSLLDRAKAKLARNTGTIEDRRLAEQVIAAKLAKIDREAAEKVAKVTQWLSEARKHGQLPKPRIRLAWYVTPRGTWVRRWVCDKIIDLPIDFHPRIFVGGRTPADAYDNWAWHYAEKMMKARNLL